MNVVVNLITFVLSRKRVWCSGERVVWGVFVCKRCKKSHQRKKKISAGRWRTAKDKQQHVNTGNGITATVQRKHTQQQRAQPPQRQRLFLHQWSLTQLQYRHQRYPQLQSPLQSKPQPPIQPQLQPPDPHTTTILTTVAAMNAVFDGDSSNSDKKDNSHVTCNSSDSNIDFIPRNHD